MQDSEKRIIFRFVSAIQIASRVIFFLEVSIKIILTHNIKRCILLAPYIGQARIHLFYFYLSQIFSTCMVEIVLYLLASHHFRSAVDNHQLVELCSLYCLSDHITVRIARDLG